MKKPRSAYSALFNPRALLAFVLGLLGVFLAVASFRGLPPLTESNDAAIDRDHEERERYSVGGGDKDSRREELERVEQEWHNRLTYPTGRFDPAWVRRAAIQDSFIPRRIPAGIRNPKLTLQQSAFARGGKAGKARNDGTNSPMALDVNAFTALGPAPGHMTGCSGCFDYGTTEGRVNTIVVDPTTTTNGSIVAYIGTDGGGVWKTTNCCSGATNWTVLTDGAAISTTAIDTLTIDPNNHNTIYAGTGDLNYGSFSQGSQGILKSIDGGANWTVLGANIFGASYFISPGTFPQYDAVGKVRVDPNNSNKVVAGTKRGLWFSYDGGTNWTGPCITNSFPAQRQDITGLELTNMGGGVTRILAAVGVRGFATTVQVSLDKNGANGLYKGTVPASGCPTDFSLITTNANGFVYSSTPVASSPYGVNANMNAGSGAPYVSASSGTQLGRMDIAVAPSAPNTIYVQVGQIANNPNGGCGNTSGCQLGLWATTDGGTNWSFMTGSAGQSLLNCQGQAGDYPQNWYDQGIAVDPNNPDRIFVDTFDVWFATRTGVAFNDLTCGYSGGNVVHVDQHALAFVPGSSDILLKGSDGGVFSSSNASTASAAVDNTWVNMDTGINTIEFYSGDISGNFATSPSPQANGGAQDNGGWSATFAGAPTGPVQWQMGKGGDGFYARIDPVGTGTSLRFWQGNNGGALSRCVSNCTAAGAAWSSRTGGWTSDNCTSGPCLSFIAPFDLFHGGIPGGDDCAAASSTTGCGHLVVGSSRVYETITGAASSTTWYITNNPTTQNLTKQSLGNRSFINQVKYSPKYQSVAIVGTNDGNVQIGFNLGTGVAAQGNWVNVTAANAVLPNRPILGIALDPGVAAANTPVGYAAVGGFDENTPSTPGHLYRVTCDANCANPVWQNKSGNLPNMPADSVIVNPNFPQQVFVGTDIGLYYTDDINAATPAWFRFNAGLPNVMIWDMQIDRGSTTLSLWTRSRGAFVWPLPIGPIQGPVSVNNVKSRMTHPGAGTFDVDLTSGTGVECRSGGGSNNYTVVFTFANSLTNVDSASVTSGTGSVGSSTIGAPNEYIVNLTGVTNAQHLTVTLNNVQDNANHFSTSVTGTLNVLVGDTTNDGSVNSGDVGQTKSQSGQPVGGGNFRNDVNVDGLANSGDVGLVKARSGTALP